MFDKHLVDWLFFVFMQQHFACHYCSTKLQMGFVHFTRLWHLVQVAVLAAVGAAGV